MLAGGTAAAAAAYGAVRHYADGAHVNYGRGLGKFRQGSSSTQA